MVSTQNPILPSPSGAKAPPLKHRLAMRIAMLTVLVSSLVTFVISGIQLYRSYDYDVQSIVSDMEQIRITQLESLAKSLWVLDVEQAQIALKGLLRIQGVEHLRLISEGKVFAEAGRPLKASVGIHRVYPLVFRHQQQNKQVGKLEVSASLEIAKRRVLEQAGIILLSNGIKTLVVVFFMLMLFRLLITRHLTKIGDFARSVANGSLEKPLDLRRNTTAAGRRDELDLLVESLNAMQAGIRESITALEAEEKRYRELVETMNDGLGVVDAKGNITYINQAFCDLLGYSAQQLMGEKWVHFLSDSESLKGSGGAEILMAGHETPQEFEFKHKSGHGVYTIVSPKFFYDDKGEISGAFGIVKDISERKKAELEIRDMNEQLEKRVEKRSGELKEVYQKLASQQKLATVGQLTATVSHELRNPLGVIGNTIHGMRLRLPHTEPWVQKGLERIERSVFRCNNIISDLLEFSRNRKPVLEKTALDSWLLEIVTEQNNPAGIEIVFDLNLTGLVLVVDQDRLRRAVINVVENALQSMDSLEETSRNFDLRLTVRSLREDERLKMIFTDTGPGISAENRRKIFEPLFSTKTYGVGLGLPTVKQIMEQEGGGIEVESQPGQGTRITLWLPVKN